MSGVAARAPGLWVTRHGPVDAAGLCYGQSDVPTTIDHASACERVAAQLEACGADLVEVWTSPWERTRGPATLLARQLHLPLRVDARLSELAFGAWEGRPYAELEATPEFARWMKAWQTAAPPGGESLGQLLERVAQWKLAVTAQGRAVLAFTHAGVVRALRASARGLPYAEVVGEAVPPLGVEAVTVK